MTTHEIVMYLSALCFLRSPAYISLSIIIYVSCFLGSFKPEGKVYLLRLFHECEGVYAVKLIHKVCLISISHHHLQREMFLILVD